MRTYNFHKTKQLLLNFWEQMGLENGVGPRRYSSDRDPNHVLRLLKEYADIKIAIKNPTLSHLDVRNKFNQEKRHRRLWGRPCLVCGSANVQRHHIIQIQNGGRNEKRNIISLCIPCHAEIHPWMKRK